jgi:hypothetical protein
VVEGRSQPLYIYADKLEESGSSSA